MPLLRVLTDRGTEYCGKVEQHEYQLYLAMNDIDHTRTKAQSPLSQRDTQVDLATAEADASAARHADGAVVERVIGILRRLVRAS